MRLCGCRTSGLPSLGCESAEVGELLRLGEWETNVK